MKSPKSPLHVSKVVSKKSAFVNERVYVLEKLLKFFKVEVMAPSNWVAELVINDFCCYEASYYNGMFELAYLRYFNDEAPIHHSHTFY